MFEKFFQHLPVDAFFVLHNAAYCLKRKNPELAKTEVHKVQ
jgi:hypothetical protein